LLTRIESTEGYKYGTPIMFVRKEDSNFLKNLYRFPCLNDNLTFDQALWGGKYIGYADIYSYNNDKKIFTMLENQFGVSLIRATNKERELVKQNSRYKKMNSYPEDSSIKIIDGILVVKF
jgi:hypothetical protein